MLRWCRCRSDHTQAGPSGVHVPAGRRRVSAKMCRMGPALGARTSSCALVDFVQLVRGHHRRRVFRLRTIVAVSLERRACCAAHPLLVPSLHWSPRPGVPCAPARRTGDRGVPQWALARARPERRAAPGRVARSTGADRTRQWRSQRRHCPPLRRGARSRHRSGNDVQPLPGVPSVFRPGTSLPSSSRRARRRMSLSLAGR